MKVIILRGISGSGKSTLATTLTKPHRVCSADKYFMTGERYIFNPKKLGEAHQSCLRHFINLVQSDYALEGKALDPIVIDNTNLAVEDVAPYVSIAQAYGAEVEILQLQCDARIAADRNIHGVPGFKVMQMNETLSQTRLPTRWAKLVRMA